MLVVRGIGGLSVPAGAHAGGNLITVELKLKQIARSIEIDEACDKIRPGRDAGTWLIFQAGTAAADGVRP